MMTDLKFGVTYRGAGDPDVGDFAAWVEELGYHSVWTGEHIANWRAVLTAIPVLGVFAARTKRIVIGSAVLLLPLRNPVIIAKELATLDVVSHGRLAVGIGIGGENPAEFAACGVPVNERAGRTNELLQILPRLWHEQAVTFHGKYFTLENVSIDPKPVQPAGPPIYVAGRREGAMRRAARYADGFMPYLYSPEQYAKAMQQVRAFAEEANRDPAGCEGALYQFITVADTKDEARRIAAESLARAYRQDFTNLADKFCVLGTPADCIARLREFIAAGARHIIFALSTPDSMATEQLTVIAKEIVPAFA